MATFNYVYYCFCSNCLEGQPKWNFHYEKCIPWWMPCGHRTHYLVKILPKKNTIRNMSYSLFYYYFFLWTKNGFMCVIIDSAHLNPLLMAWDTLEHIRAIRVIAQHFCKAHDSNLTTSKLAGMTKFETLINTPRPKSLSSSWWW